MKTINAILILGMFLFFAACEDEETNQPDPCAAITCQNGGTCNNGTCACPSGFSGTNCEINNNTNTCTGDFYINGLLDGVSFCYKYTYSGGGILLGPATGGTVDISNDYCTATYTTGIGKNVTVAAEIWFHNFFIGECSQNDEGDNLLNYFPEQSYNYTDDDTQVPGALVFYYDANGDWITKNGSQAGSNFTITSAYYNTLVLYTEVIVEGTFNCKVYNSSGASKTITNGKFKLAVQPKY